MRLRPAPPARVDSRHTCGVTSDFVCCVSDLLELQFPHIFHFHKMLLDFVCCIVLWESNCSHMFYPACTLMRLSPAPSTRCVDRRHTCMQTLTAHFRSHTRHALTHSVRPVNNATPRIGRAHRARSHGQMSGTSCTSCTQPSLGCGYHIQLQGSIKPCETSTHSDGRVLRVEGVDHVLAALHRRGAGDSAGGQAQACAQAAHDVQRRRAVADHHRSVVAPQQRLQQRLQTRQLACKNALRFRRRSFG